MTRDYPQWAAATASLTVGEKVRIKPSRRQLKENECDCRTVLQQLASSNPQSVLMRTSCKIEEQEIETQKKTVTFETPEQGLIVVESKLSEQENLSGQSDTEGSGYVDGHNFFLTNCFSGEVTWMNRS